MEVIFVMLDGFMAGYEVEKGILFEENIEFGDQAFILRLCAVFKRSYDVWR